MNRNVVTPTGMINSACTGGSCSKYTALHFAGDGNDVLYGICNHKVWVVEQLLELRANINARDEKNNTPLLLAASNGMTAVCLKLIGAGCNKDVVSDKNQGAWQTAYGRAPTTANAPKPAPRRSASTSSP